MPDPLLQRAKQVAARRGTNVRALIIEALQVSLNRKTSAFNLRDASFGGGETVSGEAINAAIDESRPAASAMV